MLVVLGLPIHCPLNKLLATEVVSGLTLSSREHFLDNALCSNTGVIAAR
jgi:hypothetical protein